MSFGCQRSFSFSCKWAQFHSSDDKSNDIGKYELPIIYIYIYTILDTSVHLFLGVVLHKYHEHVRIYITVNLGIWNLAHKQLGPWLGSLFASFPSVYARSSRCNVERPLWYPVMIKHFKTYYDFHFFMDMSDYMPTLIRHSLSWICDLHSSTFWPSVANLHSNGIALQTGLAGSQSLTADPQLIF